MITQRHVVALRLAAASAVIALALMVWSVLQPGPIPVIVAMSVGQVLGTLSFGTFLYVLVADLRSGV
jgi:hypothetical protein